VNDMLRIVRRSVMRDAARHTDREHQDQGEGKRKPPQPAFAGWRLLVAVPVSIFDAHSRLSAGATAR
jgi:hypothetical protein